MDHEGTTSLPMVNRSTKIIAASLALTLCLPPVPAWAGPGPTTMRGEQAGQGTGLEELERAVGQPPTAGLEEVTADEVRRAAAAWIHDNPVESSLAQIAGALAPLVAGQRDRVGDHLTVIWTATAAIAAAARAIPPTPMDRTLATIRHEFNNQLTALIRYADPDFSASLTPQAVGTMALALQRLRAVLWELQHLTVVEDTGLASGTILGLVAGSDPEFPEPRRQRVETHFAELAGIIQRSATPSQGRTVVVVSPAVADQLAPLMVSEPWVADVFQRDVAFWVADEARAQALTDRGFVASPNPGAVLITLGQQAAVGAVQFLVDGADANAYQRQLAFIQSVAGLRQLGLQAPIVLIPKTPRPLVFQLLLEQVARNLPGRAALDEDQQALAAWRALALEKLYQ